MRNRLRQLRDIGLRGVAKSVYYSFRNTGSLSSLVVTSQVITEISPHTTFDLRGRLTIGTGRRGASHPRIARSKFSTSAGASVVHSGEDIGIVGPGSVVHIEGEFSIGDSYINSHARILCGDEITIGNGVAIAWDVEILDDDRHNFSVNGVQAQRTAPITIEDNVWIGHSASIQKGVTIREGSVVASNSVVASDVPANTLVAGTPAEVIKEDVSWGGEN